MKTMLSKSSAEKEYRKCDRMLANWRGASDYDKGILYGGRQALGWVLRNNCAKPTNCICDTMRPEVTT